MSYYSQLQLSWDDSDFQSGNVTVEMLADIAAKFANDNNWSDEIVRDLRAACESDCLSDLGFNSAYSYGINELLEFISRNLPDVTFYAKGSGEEFFDIWVRVYRGGVATTQYGPFEVDAKTMLTGDDVVIMDAELRDAFDKSHKQQTGKPWWKRIMRS